MEEIINCKARDDRFFRAAETVLKKYRIQRRPGLEDGLVVFDITGGTTPYVVRIHPQWHTAPTCTCPDASQYAKVANRGYCKHIIGTLLDNEEFRCQLLETFL